MAVCPDDLRGGPRDEARPRVAAAAPGRRRDRRALARVPPRRSRPRGVAPMNTMTSMNAAAQAANGGAHSNEIARHIEAVTRSLLGEPNKGLSTKTELRFGTNGSLSVDLEKGTWF